MSSLRRIAAAFGLFLAVVALPQPARAGVPAVSWIERAVMHTSVRNALLTESGGEVATRFLGRAIRTEADFALFAASVRQSADAAFAADLERTFARVIERAALKGGEGALEAALLEFSNRELGLLLGRPRATAGKVIKSNAEVRRAFLAAAPVTERWKVAAVQFPIENGLAPADFLQKVRGYAREAKAQGAGVVVFPELTALDLIPRGTTEQDAAALKQVAEKLTPQIFESVQAMAKEEGLAILAGSFPRSTPKGVVNTAILAFPEGRVVLQDKLFLTPDEVAWGWVGGDELKVFDAPWGRTTILICYDSQFPALSHELRQALPEVVLVPSMTGSKGLKRVRWASQARAVEHHAYVVVTGTTDPVGRAGRDYSGQAVFLTPQEEGFPGLLQAGKKDVPSVVSAELDLIKLRQSRVQSGIYSVRDFNRRTTPIRVVDGK